MKTVLFAIMALCLASGQTLAQPTDRTCELREKIVAALIQQLADPASPAYGPYGVNREIMKVLRIFHLPGSVNAHQADNILAGLDVDPGNPGLLKRLGEFHGKAKCGPPVEYKKS